jgi:hypothetical protein
MGTHRHVVILTNDIDIPVGGMRDNVDPWVANEKTRQDVAYRYTASWPRRPRSRYGQLPASPRLVLNSSRVSVRDLVR